MEYAIIETGGKQYKVTPGMVIDVENLGQDSGEFSFDKVLLHVNGDDMKLGAPYISGFSVTGKILGAKKGEKVRVSQYKSKVRHRRTIGFRQSLLTVEIANFGKAEKKPTKSK